MRVLVGDDLVLMERLIRFAQAHDLLKRHESVRRSSRWISMRCWRRTGARCTRSRSSLLTRTVCGHLPLLLRVVDVCFRREQFDQLVAKKLAVDKRASEQSETLQASAAHRKCSGAHEELHVVNAVSGTVSS